jgi:hypothetical protein
LNVELGPLVGPRREMPRAGRSCPLDAAARSAPYPRAVKKKHRPAVEVIRRTLWFHCGWGVSVEPSFEHDRDAAGPNVLHLHDDGTDRSVSLSAYRIARTDGAPWRADDMLAEFPPPELTGIRYQHRTRAVSSRALWLFGDSDSMPSAWVLVALVMSETTPGKAAHCTITTPRESDLGWALETWHGVLYVPDKDDEAARALLR